MEQVNQSFLSYFLPNWPGWADSNIVMGQDALDFPSQLPLQRSHTVDIAIPGAAGRSGLVSNALLKYRKRQGIGVGLDASGNGQVIFQLPNQSALVGQTIYARFMVPDVASPALSGR